MYYYHYTVLSILYCNTAMRYVDTNETKLMTGDGFVHIVKFMLIIYIQYMQIGRTRPILKFIFGKRTGRHNATQIRESWLWGQVADMMELERGWGHPVLRAMQERQRLLKGEGKYTQATGQQTHVMTRP